MWKSGESRRVTRSRTYTVCTFAIDSWTRCICNIDRFQYRFARTHFIVDRAANYFPRFFWLYWKILYTGETANGVPSDRETEPIKSNAFVPLTDIGVLQLRVFVSFFLFTNFSLPSCFVDLPSRGFHPGSLHSQKNHRPRSKYFIYLFYFFNSQCLF